MSQQQEELMITLVVESTGQSESFSASPTMTVSALSEWAVALFGLSSAQSLVFKHQGKTLATNMTLAQAGVQTGDLLAVGTAAPAPPAPALGGLDFSSLLQSPAAAASTASSTSNSPPAPVYYNGMTLQDAMHENPHPVTFCQLLFAQESLQKQLHYHAPRLGLLLLPPNKQLSLDEAAALWRAELVKGGIQGALQATTAFHRQAEMQTRLQQNPTDQAAVDYFKKQEAKKLVAAQYQQMMEEYPESMGRVLMLYIAAKINGHAVQAFCDTGAQSTILSKKLATECGLLDLVDTRFAGTAVGVGTGKILGRIHLVQLQIGASYFPCTVTVMDDPAPAAAGDDKDAVAAKEMPFLLGLDMMKRHQCTVDLSKGQLQFNLGPGKVLTTPFLHEHDLTVLQGGTKDYNVELANQEYELAVAAEGKDNDDDEKDKKMDES